MQGLRAMKFWMQFLMENVNRKRDFKQPLNEKLIRRRKVILKLIASILK